MKDKLSVEELAIDDSFINYCLGKDKDDFYYWEQYVHQHPLESETIEEAKQIVLGLYIMFNESETTHKITQPREREIDGKEGKSVRFRRIFNTVSVAAAILIFIFFIGRKTDPAIKKDRIPPSISKVENSGKDLIYRTINGERKLVILPDSTKIWMNSGTLLKVSENYGKKDRNVYLTGEALFDVKHDESLPFTVFTSRYEVKDMGTTFNIKAYKGEKESETSLIKGRIQVKVNGENSRRIDLKPNEKIVVWEDSVVLKPDNISAEKNRVELSYKVKPLSYDRSDSLLIETAWVRNRLEINDEDFYQMKDKLERWFNVKITIQDKKVGGYRFTATFENENIQKVLQALQYAYPFNYKIENNEVTILK